MRDVTHPGAMRKRTGSYQHLVALLCLSFLALLSGAGFAQPEDGGFQLGHLGMVAKLGQSRDADDRQLALMTALGVNVVIWTPGEWAGNEKTPSNYALTPEVKYVIARIAALRMRMVVLLFRKNPLYANPLDPDAFARYSKWLAATLKNAPVAAYQVWNEPSNFDVRAYYGGSWNGRGDAPWVGKFSELTKAAAQAVLEADPRATVITSFEGPPLLYALKDHPQDFEGIRGISIHPYPGKLPAEQVPWGGSLIELRDGVSVADPDGSLVSTLRIQTHDAPVTYLGHPLEVWVTEYGFPTCDPGSSQKHFACVAPEVQAAYQARGLLVGLAHGVKVWAPYELSDEGRNWSDPEDNFGLTKGAADDYAPKPAFYTIVRIARVLGLNWRFLPRPPATLQICARADSCAPAPVREDSSVVGPQMLWFETRKGYAGFIWDAGEFHAGAAAGRIEWHAPGEGPWRWIVTDLLSGAPIGGFPKVNSSAAPFVANVPVGSGPVVMEVSRK